MGTNKTLEKSKYLFLYSKVFDKFGDVKDCGRELCKNLIALAEDITGDNRFGNKDTGIMNVEEMSKLYDSLI